MVLTQDGRTGQWLHWQHLHEAVSACSLDDVLPTLRAIEHEVNRTGLTAVGFVSYEAAGAFDAALQTHGLSGFPLLWFGLFERAQPIELPGSTTGYELGSWEASVTPAQFTKAVFTIKQHIARGETYQVNYTYRLRTSFAGNALSLLSDLNASQKGCHGAYLDIGDHVICSVSPERFFTLSGNELVSQPMKGTVKRGLTLEEDREQAEWLRHSEKNRAENVMIVDMIRNDMGRIARLGTVSVPALFDIARYPTLWQMTSTVTAQTDASLSEIFTAMFPCASITGAPKTATMHIIKELESSPRGIYTGAIGTIGPNRQAHFNVAIRTLHIDKSTSRATYGVGGGIVWDSEPEAELAECRTKARVLTTRLPDVSLLETILWEPESGYFLLERHLARLMSSAEYFNISVDEAELRRQLTGLAQVLGKPSRVRLLVTEQGKSSLEVSSLVTIDSGEPVRLVPAAEPVNSGNRFLYHKTTRREVYDRALAAQPEAEDVLLWNEREEVTESTIANVVFELDGRLVTPPVTSGLLAGTFRAELLENGIICEQVVTPAEAERASAVWLINSVRKWRRALLIQPATWSMSGQMYADLLSKPGV